MVESISTAITNKKNEFQKEPHEPLDFSTFNQGHKWLIVQLQN